MEEILLIGILLVGVILMNLDTFTGKESEVSQEMK